MSNRESAQPREVSISNTNVVANPAETVEWQLAPDHHHPNTPKVEAVTGAFLAFIKEMVRYQSTTPSSSSPPDTPGFRMSVNGKDKDLFDELRALHADEFAYLQKRLKGSLDEWQKSWWHRCFDMVVEYVKYIVESWIKCAWAMVFFPLTLADRVSMIIMSFAACAVISVLFLWCLLISIPNVKTFMNWALDKSFGGLSLVNFAYPMIFTDLKKEQVRAAREHLSKPPKQMCSTDGRQTRVFNLDAAKVLLQCAALMYERTAKQTRRVARSAAENKVPPMARDTTEGDQEKAGSYLRQVCGEKSAEAVKETLIQGNAEEDMIRSIAMEDLGLHYYSVSECNSLGSAFCALFWDPTHSFIIVAFKGTSPTDFMEWRTDFSFHMTPANEWVNGFGRVHEGFMGKIFPKQIHSSIPYDTIVKAIRAVSDHLHQNIGSDAKINVWITGHSLGCALASVAYARMVNEIRELGPNIRVRDAYLFAAPILCDVISAGAFNNRMNHYSNELNFQKTMWRVTNGNDAVACLLPEGGDNSRWAFSPWNLFAFSHLGAEIKMRCAPTKCVVAGGHITPGTTVKISSAYQLDALEEDPTGEAQEMRKSLESMQKWPLVGRLVAHAPGCYWASLMKVGTGVCEWEEE